MRIISLILISGIGHVAFAQQIDLSNQTWSAEVIRDRGQPVIPLFDGWYPNADGTRTLCFGFFNMNSEQALTIPLGDSNYLDSDYLDANDLDANDLDDERYNAYLPTHFDPLPPAYRHVFCAFTVTVGEDFGRDEKIYWHLSSNGQDLRVPGHILPAFVLDEPNSTGRGDIAPVITIDDESARGRTGIHASQISGGQTGEPVSLRASIAHPDEEVWVGWAKHSGPGDVDFSEKEYSMPSGSTTEVSATFSRPGEYIVRLQTIDDIAAFEFYCCHSNAYFHISVGNP